MERLKVDFETKIKNLEANFEKDVGSMKIDVAELKGK